MHSTPSYKGYLAATDAASKVGRGNKKVGTRPERLLVEALRGLGLRFSRHDRHLPGNPDIVFRSQSVAVFCDGAFWHGRHWQERRAKLEKGANAEYWLAKISQNRRRDRRVNRELRSRGWLVIRVWDLEVSRDAQQVARSIARRVALRLRS